MITICNGLIVFFFLKANGTVSNNHSRRRDETTELFRQRIETDVIVYTGEDDVEADHMR